MILKDDITDPRWIIAKGFLFLVLALIASVSLLALHPDWISALLLALAVWAACRWYYFMFYVIEKYVDPSFKFDGLTSFVKYLRGSSSTK